MNEFLMTFGVFCVLHIVPPPPLLEPPTAQRLELEAKENQGCSASEEQERLAEVIEALVEELLANKEVLEKSLEKKRRNLE